MEQPPQQLEIVPDDGQAFGGTDQGSTPGSISRTPVAAAEAGKSNSRSTAIVHKVTKQDTLAGVALRYNVSVADIKRANGLLSDNAMYGCDVLHIPSQTLPLGEEVQMLFAQVATSLGRDPVLDADANFHPAAAAAARVTRTIQTVHGTTLYPPSAIDGVPWWCQCGMCYEDDLQPRCRSQWQLRNSGSMEQQQPGEVELMERNVPDGHSHLRGRVRRRRAEAAGSSLDACDDSDTQYGDMCWGAEGHREQWHRSSLLHPSGQQPANAPGGASSRAGPEVKQLLKTVSDFGSLLMHKIVEAASQPALASGASSSLSEAADGVLNSIKQLQQPWSSASSPPMSRSSAAVQRGSSNNGQQALLMSSRKAGSKDE